MNGRASFVLSLGVLFVALPVLAIDWDPATGLVIADGSEVVRLKCTGCHSAKLVTQNRATRQGWTEIIRWMQRTQKLGALGDDKAIIIDYLARHYGPAPGSTARRRPLPPELRPASVHEDLGEKP